MNADGDLQLAITALAQGQVVVVPTDTVYGLAARPDRPEAVANVFELKGRERQKALPVLGADLDSLRDIVEFDERALTLANEFWPGPLMLVLSRRSGWEHDLGAGVNDSVAVRVPDSAETQRLLSSAGPLAVTSANRSGRRPAANVEEARALFEEEVAVFIDGGSSGGGVASTVVSLVGELSILRSGPIDADDLRQTLTP